MTTIPLRQLGAEHLDRWVCVDGLTGVLHSVGHSRTGITSVDVRMATAGIRLGFGRPEIEHYTSDTKVELLAACEVCQEPIVGEEPVWGGADGDEPLHRHCVPDDNPDHALSIPTSEHTVTVPGYGDAAVAEVAGTWNWRCGRQGCGIGAVCILTVEQADRSARWHLEHEHDPLPAELDQAFRNHIIEETKQ